MRDLVDVWALSNGSRGDADKGAIEGKEGGAVQKEGVCQANKRSNVLSRPCDDLERDVRAA